MLDDIFGQAALFQPLMLQQFGQPRGIFRRHVLQMLEAMAHAVGIGDRETLGDPLAIVDAARDREDRLLLGLGFHEKRAGPHLRHRLGHGRIAARLFVR